MFDLFDRSLATLGREEPHGAEPARFAAEARGRCRARGVGRQAASAIDIALLDLCGKLEGLPAWRLLGASAAAPVACNASIGADPPDAAASAAVSAVRAGFGTLKVKVGDAGDLDRVRAVRAATGPGALLRVDANGSWDPPAALARIRGQQAFALASLGDRAGARRLAREVLRLRPTEKRAYLALLISTGLVSGEQAMKAANWFGKGI